MTKVSREEIMELARISRLNVHEDEVADLIDHVGQVLSYAERVTEVAADLPEPIARNVNVFREDVAINIDPEPILAQAPEREGNYFVVPRIIESNE